MNKINISAEALEPIFNKIGELTKVQRYLIYCGTISAIVIAFVYFFYMPKQTEISNLNKEKKKVAGELAKAKIDANQLKTYEKKMEEAKVQFEIVKNTLPEKKDIPSLLTGISQAGRDSGLEFTLFKPNNEVKKQFYAEIPVSIQLTGQYHNIAVFFDKVAKLPRIVNIRDIKLTSKKGSNLSATCQAVTYRFLETQ
jgi:type IV pilus assembly protein PilO